ncbi:MAG TPA: metallophosphoesterase [Jatrophihabitans sp.]|jgi:hypothetical protein
MRVVAVVGRWVLRLTLPLVCLVATLSTFPYRTTVDGIPLSFHGTLFTRPGFSADTSLGNWVFPDVSTLPFGVHVRLDNINLLQVSAAAAPDPAAYAEHLQQHIADRVPFIAAWLIGESVLAIGIGLLASTAISMAARYLGRLERRPNEIRLHLRHAAVAVAVLLGFTGYGLATYNEHWVQRSHLTGTLAAAELFPDQLTSYYQRGTKVYDVLGSVAGIQAALQHGIEQERTPDTAARIMFISDMHLADTYPLIAQYASNYNVDLIINTGDETEFGSTIEMTPSYLAALRSVTKVAPMVWIAGNHDSPSTVHRMRTVQGVTVLGTKTTTSDGYVVTAGELHAFGLAILGVSDPRVYGGIAPFNSNDGPVTEKLERDAVDHALAGFGKDQNVDIFATHEPVAATEARKLLPDQIRQTNYGHLHEQNKSSALQHGSQIDLQEGSTGAGGLDNIVRGTQRPPIEFSIESVDRSCQFTRVVRFQIQPEQLQPISGVSSYGDDVQETTVYFQPQSLTAGRVCGTNLGIQTVPSTVGLP